MPFHNIENKIKIKINYCKKKYKDKIVENLNFQCNNMRSMWQSLKQLTGYSSVK